MVERDDQLIVVDDERMRFEPGEKPVMRKVRFRTLGCWPLTAAIESDADDLDGIVAETLAAQVFRAGRAADRPRSGRRHGDEEARGVLLMSLVDAGGATEEVGRAEQRFRERLPRARGCQQPGLKRACCQAADLRLGRRRQIDADRPAAVGRGRRHRGSARGDDACLA